AIDETFDGIKEVDVPADWATIEVAPEAPAAKDEPGYIKNILEPITRQEGDKLSVKDLIDNGMLAGQMPSGTAAYEKRGIALEVPQWIPENCTECNQCAYVCPHAAIRPFLADEDEMAEAPEGYIVRDMKGADGLKYRIQVSVEDCTGCGLCYEACPAPTKALKMVDYAGQKEQNMNWAFAMTLRQKTNPMKKL
ncbi:4Fe-4S binding protein, partial [Loigolactobacillus bifermentans]